MKTTRIIPPSLVLAALLGFTGCDPIGSENPAGDYDTRQPPAAWVAGTWTLSGRGSWSGCGDPSLAVGFTIASDVPLHVAQTSGGGGIGLLSLEEPMVPVGGGTFSFNGTVTDTATSFTTIEETADYRLVFDFDGEIAGSIITGTFTGGGLEDCSAAGEFEVSISPTQVTDGGGGGDPGPGDPGIGDPGIGDPNPGDPLQGDATPAGDFGLGPRYDPEEPEFEIGCRAVPPASAWLVLLPLLRRRRNRGL